MRDLENQLEEYKKNKKELFEVRKSLISKTVDLWENEIDEKSIKRAYLYSKEIEDISTNVNGIEYILRIFENKDSYIFNFVVKDDKGDRTAIRRDFYNKDSYLDITDLRHDEKIYDLYLASLKVIDFVNNGLVEDVKRRSDDLNVERKIYESFI